MAWMMAGALAVIVMIQALKIRSLQQSAREIALAFAERLSTDTNTLVDISSRDKYMLSLAAAINQQLKLLRKQRQQYLSGDRELKEAVTNISHDLRTPLTAICGYLDLLDREEKSTNVTRYLVSIENRIEALKQLTEELFRYSVILTVEEKLQLEPVNLKGALEESVASFYGALTERGITPMISMPEAPVACMLNKQALSRVFSNMLNNALKYSDGDLEIELKTSGEIVFTNTTSSLDEVHVGKLFDRFFTIEAARNSTGLGLSISKTLVERMNGSISAKLCDQQLSILVAFPIAEMASHQRSSYMV